MELDDELESAFELTEWLEIQARLGGSIASLDESTFDFALKRSFYVAVFVDAGPSADYDQLLEPLLEQVRGAIRAEHASIDKEFGPYPGSRLQLIFSSSDDFIVGSTFTQRLKRIRAKLKPALQLAGKGVVVGLIVANGALTAVGDEKAIKEYHVPPPVVMLVHQANNAISLVMGVKSIVVPAPKQAFRPKDGDYDFP